MISPYQVSVEGHPKHFDVKDSLHRLVFVEDLNHRVPKVVPTGRLLCREKNHFGLLCIKTKVLLNRPSVQLVYYVLYLLASLPSVG